MQVSDLPETCILYFTAKWCGPCQRVKPLLTELEKTYNASRPDDIIQLIKIDIDDEDDLPNYFKVSSIPNITFIKNGETIMTVIGADDQKIRQGFEKTFANQIYLPTSKKAEVQKNGASNEKSEN